MASLYPSDHTFAVAPVPARNSLSSQIGLYSILAANFGFWIAVGIGLGPLSVSFSQVFIIIAFATCLFQWGTSADRIPASTRAALRPIVWTSIAMIGVGMASMVTAADPIGGVRFISRWAFGMLYLIAFVQFVVDDKRGLRKAIRAFLYGGVAIVPLLLVGRFYSPLGELVFWDLYSYRANGFMEHPNQFAMISLVGLVLAQLPGLMNRKLWLFVVLALLFNLVSAGSKANMVLAVLILPVVFFWLPAREGRAVQALGGIGAGFIAAFAAIGAGIYYLQTYNSYYYGKLVEFALDPTGADTTQSRGETWSRSIDCMLERPVFGIGGGNAEYCIDYVHAHNVFVNYLLETGIVGFITLLAFLVLIIYPLTQVSKKLAYGLGASAYNTQLFRSAGLVLMAIVLFIFSNSTSDSLGSSTMPVIWMLAGIGLAMNTIIHRKAARPQVRSKLRPAAAPPKVS